MLEVTCPSGLRGVVRSMKVKDEQIFADRKIAQSGKIITRLLSACWQETLDSGPYSFGDKPNFDDLLSSDRNHLVIQIRMASYGKEYTFATQCVRCLHKFGWGVNLDEFAVTPVSPEGLEFVKTGEPIPVELSNGDVIKCRLLNGHDEAFFANLSVKEQSKLLTYHLARKIVDFNGETHWRDILAQVEDMEASVADDLWNKMDEIEGGIDTMFEVECPACANGQEVILPFEAGFFSNRKRFARSKTNETG